MNIQFDILVQRARDEAKRYHHKFIRTEHLFLALVQDYDLITDSGKVDVACVRASVGMLRCPTCDAEAQMELSARAERAWRLAQSRTGNEVVTHQHLLWSILQSSLTVQRILMDCGVDVSSVVANLESMMEHGK